jgi:hypothetical protein
MRALHYALGLTLLMGGLVMMVVDQHKDLLWPAFEIFALISGGIFINRAVTNKLLFKTSIQLSLTNALNTKKKWLGILGLVFLFFSAIIPLLGSDNYLGFNKSHATLGMVCNLVIGILGAFFLWLYLRPLKRPNKTI